MADGDQIPGMGIPGLPGFPGLMLPQESTTITQPTSSQQRTDVSPERAADIESQRQAMSQDIEARTRMISPQELLAQQLAENAKAREDLAAQNLRDLTAKQDEYTKGRAALKEESIRRQQEYEAAAKGRLTTMWEDKGAPAEIVSHLLVGLSEKSHRLAGGRAGESPMQLSLNRALADDERKKLARFENSKEGLQLAKENEAAFEAERLKVLSDIKDTQLVAIDGLIKKAETYTAQYTSATARDKAQSAIGELKAQYGKTLADQDAIHDIQVRSEGPRVTTTRNIPQAGVQPRNVILSKAGDKVLATGIDPSITDRTRIMLTSADAISTAVDQAHQAKADYEERKKRGEAGAASDDAGLREAYERVARVALTNNIVEAADDKGNRINLNLGIVGGGIGLGKATKTEDVIDDIFKNTALLDTIKGEMRAGIRRNMTRDVIPKETQDKILNDYLPTKAAPAAATQAQRAEFMTQMVSAISIGNREGARAAAQRAREAGIPEATIQSMVRAVGRGGL